MDKAVHDSRGAFNQEVAFSLLFHEIVFDVAVEKTGGRTHLGSVIRFPDLPGDVYSVNGSNLDARCGGFSVEFQGNQMARWLFPHLKITDADSTKHLLSLEIAAEQNQEGRGTLVCW